MEAAKVVVAVRDFTLRKVLTLWLRDAMPGRDIRAGDSAEEGEVMVTTAIDVSPAEAAELQLRGTAVVILTPMPRSEERERYGLAGASYVAMSFDGSRALESAIEQASVPRVPAKACG
jgi:hypothetical protein